MQDTLIEGKSSNFSIRYKCFELM